jgi:TonB-linked SusC/RagA family outer membrane protein
MKNRNVKKPASFLIKVFPVVLQLFILLTLLPSAEALAVETPSPRASVPPHEFSLVISGQVVNEAGNALSGVDVIEKGTSNGVITKEDGSFTINVKDRNAVLVISHVGYLSQEIKVGDKRNLTVALKAEASKLDDVVVVGYGTQKKATLTGAVTSIKGDQVVTTKNEAIVNSLAGKMPGVIVVQNSAQPGTYSNTFNIRGLGNPLIVIDGVIQNDANVFYRMNPNDIESISVLKDASAAVYGFRSANGVVLVTTKKGQAGKFTLEYNGTYGIQRRSGVPLMADPVQYMTIANQMAERAGGPAAGLSRVFPDSLINLYKNGTLKGTDWINLCMAQNSPETQHTLSATGGNDRITFYSALSYLYQDGLFKNNALTYNRYSLTNNITAKLTKSLNVKFNLQGISDNRNQPYVDVNNFFYTVWNMNTLQAPYWDAAQQYPQQSWLDYGWNPVVLMDPNKVGYKKFNNLYANTLMELTYDAPFLKGLQLSFTGSYNYSNNNNTAYDKQYSLYADTTATYLTNNPNGNVQQSPSTIQRQFYVFTQWVTRVQAQYRRSFRGHNVNALILAEQSERKGDDFSAQKDLALPVPYLFAGVVNSNQNAGMDAGNNTTPYPYDFINRAVVGRLAYDYKAKYLAEFAFRNDGSSRFTSKKQWGFFPTASLGWRISEENFFKNTRFLSAVDNLKFRASYGVLGDDGAATYQFLTGYNYPPSGSIVANAVNVPSGAVFNGNFVLATQSRGIANPDLTWYTSKTFDAGLDYGMWNDKLGITFDFFVRNRSGLLDTRSGALAGIVGASLPQENLNSDQSHGFELALSHHSNIGKFVLDVMVSAAYTRTYWKAQPGKALRTNSYDNWLNNTSNRPTDVNFLVQAGGQYQNWDQILNSPWYVPNGTLPGDYYYYDYSGGGQQNGNNYTYSKYPALINSNGAFPLMNFGSTIGLRYENIDLAVVLQGATLRYSQLPGDFTRFSIGQAKGNGIADFINSWHTANPNADPYDPTQTWVPGYYPMNGNAVPTTTTLYYVDDSYVRLKSVELGYSIPLNLLREVGIQSARFFINGYNLLTLQKAPKSMDPEHPGNNGLNSGYAYPLNKAVNFGVDLKF